MLGAINIVAFVPTRDFEKARSFYEGLLGLRFVKNDGFAMVLDANGIMVRVSKVPELSPLSSRFWDGKFPASRKWLRRFRKEECTSSDSDSSSKTNSGFGRLPVATR